MTWRAISARTIARHVYIDMHFEPSFLDVNGIL